VSTTVRVNEMSKCLEGVYMIEHRRMPSTTPFVIPKTLSLSKTEDRITKSKRDAISVVLPDIVTIALIESLDRLADITGVNCRDE
jgi:hypothetical protein